MSERHKADDPRQGTVDLTFKGTWMRWPAGEPVIVTLDPDDIVGMESFERGRTGETYRFDERSNAHGAYDPLGVCGLVP